MNERVSSENGLIGLFVGYSSSSSYLCYVIVAFYNPRINHISLNSMVKCTREKKQNHINIYPKKTMTGNCTLYSPEEEKGRWGENAKPPLMMLKSNL